MPYSDYKEALKLGQREFRACTARGEYPCLPALSDFVPAERINRGVDMGTAQIPMEFVVGTVTGGRTSAFARNFMPVIDVNSEFAAKWTALCASHLEEGIRDAIKCYEYMNRYYVEEGNKRVSVLKYFGAESVYAHVIRVLPERSGSPEVERYYELLDFYRLSGTNSIEFSKQGSAAELQTLLGKEPDERWSEDDRMSFNSACYYFRRAYEASGGNRLTSTVGDAILAFLRVYGWQTLRGSTEGEIKKLLAKVWEEIALQQEESPIDVKLAPEEKKPGLIAKVLIPDEGRGSKVAFIHDKDPASAAWTKGHERGRLHVQRVFGGKIETTPYFNALEDDPYQVIERAIRDGNTILFTTSPRLLPASLRAAVEHPEVSILNCSLNQSHRYIRTYYARMYEAKFVVGAVAGALAGRDDVGYLCDYPIFGQIAGVNAFALGVQMVNPTAKVYLEWTSVDGAGAAMKRLTDRGIRLMSSQDMTRQGDESWASFGLSLVSEGGRVNLAVPVWNWGVYYEEMLRRIRDKSFRAEYEETERAVNYYWGMSAGVVEVRCSEKVPPITRKLADLLQRSIRADLCRPFRGTLYAQGGREMKGDLTTEQIITMDWLMENVEGSIPSYDQLTDVGKATVDQVGVKPAAKDRKG